MSLKTSFAMLEVSAINTHQSRSTISVSYVCASVKVRIIGERGGGTRCGGGTGCGAGGGTTIGCNLEQISVAAFCIN